MLKKIQSHPAVYMITQGFLGAIKSRIRLLEDYGQIQDGLRILDIGCGPGFVVRYLGDVKEYFGFDISPEYIQHATKKYGSDKIHFRCELFTAEVAKSLGKFDLVLMNGLLHHLNDAEVSDILALAKSVLIPGGRVLTLDGCYTTPQNPVAKWLLKNDRGEFVRFEQTYLDLSSRVFSDIKSHIRTDYLNVPYTMLIQELKA